MSSQKQSFNTITLFLLEKQTRTAFNKESLWIYIILTTNPLPRSVECHIVDPSDASKKRKLT